jgi:hypothetical protein
MGREFPRISPLVSTLVSTLLSTRAMTTVELLTHLTAGLLASGHFTLPVTFQNGNHVTKDPEEQIIRYFHPDIGGQGRHGYTGPPAVIQVAVTILHCILSEVDQMEGP